MSFCDFCEDEFEGGEEVMMVIEGTWGISEMSGRAILIETETPVPKYWHPHCYVQARLQDPDCELLVEDLRAELVEEMMSG